MEVSLETDARERATPAALSPSVSDSLLVRRPLLPFLRDAFLTQLSSQPPPCVNYRESCLVWLSCTINTVSSK